mmetsp:Transcript_59712/g.143392  ORF Transcript_59712/g.143392 Transcript_59712/m.143392 type:complete len:212 (-) Transcript_59712:1382-2017(-)
MQRRRRLGMRRRRRLRLRISRRSRLRLRLRPRLSRKRTAPASTPSRRPYGAMLIASCSRMPSRAAAFANARSAVPATAPWPAPQAWFMARTGPRRSCVSRRGRRRPSLASSAVGRTAVITIGRSCPTWQRRGRALPARCMRGTSGWARAPSIASRRRRPSAPRFPCSAASCHTATPPTITPGGAPPSCPAPLAAPPLRPSWAPRSSMTTSG